MGTKLNPGSYDCYAKAQDDEPIFVLRANDPTAPFAIRKWARRRSLVKGNDAKYEEAMKIALDMETWRKDNE